MGFCQSHTDTLLPPPGPRASGSWEKAGCGFAGVCRVLEIQHVPEWCRTPVVACQGQDSATYAGSVCSQPWGGKAVGLGEAG